MIPTQSIFFSSYLDCLMRFSLKKLLVFVTTIVLICAAPTCWHQIQLQRFKTYIDRDLQSLSDAEFETFTSVTNSILNRPDYREEPTRIPKPYFLKRLPSGKLVLVERSLAAPIPGHSLIRVSTITYNGRLLSEAEFPAGWRIGIVGAQAIPPDSPNEFQFVVKTELQFAGRDVAKQFYTIIGNDLFLLRLEDSLGNPLPNETGHFKIGPELPEKYDAALVRKQRYALVTRLKNARTGNGPAVVVESAESVLRTFLMARALGDINVLRRLSLDHPELEVLHTNYLSGASANRLAKMSSQVPMRECTAGESIFLPNGKQLKVSDSMVNEQRKLFVTSQDPVPFSVHLIDGRWKIDPGPSIDAQKALDE